MLKLDHNKNYSMLDIFKQFSKSHAYCIYMELDKEYYYDDNKFIQLFDNQDSLIKFIVQQYSYCIDDDCKVNDYTAYQVDNIIFYTNIQCFYVTGMDINGFNKFSELIIDFH